MDVFCIVQQTVKLSTPTKKTQLQTPLAYNNTLAHSMRVSVVNDDGTDAELTGVGVTASMMRADGETVTPILGTASGNVAEVILPGACYVVPGRFKFCMNLFKATDPTGIDTFSASDDYAKGDLVKYNDVVYRFTADHDAGEWIGTDAVADGSSRTVLWVEGYVERNTSENIVDPGTPVGNIETAIGNANAAAASANTAAAAAQAVTASSVRYDITQSLTAAQKTTARANIGLTFADDGTGNITIS